MRLLSTHFYLMCSFVAVLWLLFSTCFMWAFVIGFCFIFLFIDCCVFVFFLWWHRISLWYESTSRVCVGPLLVCCCCDNSKLYKVKPNFAQKKTSSSNSPNFLMGNLRRSRLDSLETYRGDLQFTHWMLGSRNSINFSKLALKFKKLAAGGGGFVSQTTSCQFQTECAFSWPCWHCAPPLPPT